VLLFAKKKEKVITLRMDHESLQTVEDYAKGKGISVDAYINSYHDNERIEKLPPYLL
jgi:predicted DNA binding CopG/RHH family protein